MGFFLVVFFVIIVKSVMPDLLTVHMGDIHIMFMLLGMWANFVITHGVVAPSLHGNRVEVY